MKTIKQNVEVNFNAINIKDVIILLPLMNELKKAINYEEARKIKNNLPKEKQKRYAHIHHYRLKLDLTSIINIFNLLNQLGFTDIINLNPEDILNKYKIK